MVARAVRDFEGLRVVTDDWPVVLVELPGGRVSDFALQSAFSFLEHLFTEAKDGGAKIFTIVDLSRMHQLATATQRSYASEWMSRTLPLQKLVSLGGANITPSMILRGVVTAIHWISPPPVPSVFVATRREAFAAAVRAFDAAHLPLPAGLGAGLPRR